MTDTITIPAHLITDNATLSLSGSTITLEFPTRADAEVVLAHLNGRFPAGAAERIVSPDAFAYHDDVTPEGIAEVRARAAAHRPPGPWKVIEGYDPAQPEAEGRGARSQMSHSDLVEFYDQHVGTPCEEIRHREQVRELHRRAQKAEGKLLRFGRPYLISRLAHYIGQRSLDRRRALRAEADAREQHKLTVDALAMVLFLGMSMSERG